MDLEEVEVGAMEGVYSIFIYNNNIIDFIIEFLIDYLKINFNILNLKNSRQYDYYKNRLILKIL